MFFSYSCVPLISAHLYQLAQVLGFPLLPQLAKVRVQEQQEALSRADEARKQAVMEAEAQEREKKRKTLQAKGRRYLV
jgi:hypothetical protein